MELAQYVPTAQRMPHPPQLYGSLAGFTHFAPQQRRPWPQGAAHPAPPELPLPELVLPELLPPELLPLEFPLLEPPEPPLLDAPLLEPPPLPEPPPAPSAEASPPVWPMKVAPPQWEAATTRPTNPIGKQAIQRTIHLPRHVVLR
ncbi:MAG: hypothetical protein M3O46_11830 [Myxococcota bacterium]|nr:hypothetical protein [Myxococcota bacterium]